MTPPSLFSAPRLLPARVQPPAGFALPGGDSIRLDDETEGIWVCVNPAGEPTRVEPALSTVLLHPVFSREREAAALARLVAGACDEGIHLFGGFVLERLYLDPFPPPDRAADAAARAARLLIRFWSAEAERGSRRGAIALPMLRRTYWRALSRIAGAVDRRLAAPEFADRWQGLDDRQALAELPEYLATDPEHAWLTGWLTAVDLRDEHDHALRQWQDVCLRDDHAWFFVDWLCPWHGRSPREWQLVREEELDATVWADEDGPPAAANPAAPRGRVGRDHGDRRLRPPGVETAEGRARLEEIVRRWYLPRYDLAAAATLERAVADAEGGRWRSLNARMSFGVARLLAGIGVGYLVTALQGDTWRLLVGLVADRRAAAVLIAAALMAGTFLYLVHGIRRATGLTSARAGWARAWAIWIRGELFALAGGFPVAWAVAPILDSGFAAGDLVPVVALYAQVALFVGVFTQLLFDDKPATAPLAAP